MSTLNATAIAPNGQPEVRYPDSVAQSHTTRPSSLGTLRDALFTQCPTAQLAGECSHGEQFRKLLVCNREWCDDYCGGVDGRAHVRRLAKWMPKARQIAAMGYFVVTIPPEERYRFRTREQLAALGVAVKRLMERCGYARGLRRWHWFGECPKHPDEDCRCPRAWHPHLNVLVDGGWLDGARLERVKEGVARILGISMSRVNVHYEYAKEADRIAHMVSYVLRPTFRDARWDESMAWQVIGLKNTLTWGKWDDEPVWGEDACEGSAELEAVVNGECPIDHTPIRWSSDVLPADTPITQDFRELGAGLYMRLRPDMPAPPPQPPVPYRYRVVLSVGRNDGLTRAHERAKGYMRRREIRREIEEAYWRTYVGSDVDR